MNEESTFHPLVAKDSSDASMVNRMRLLLSTSCLLTLFIDPEGMGKMNDYTALVFTAYLLYCLALNVLAPPLLRASVVCWLDVAWFYLIILVTGGSASFFYLFFFFAILSASFSFGFEHGARITLASALLFATTAVTAQNDATLSRVLLRATFLLALGYMISHWGGLVVAQKRRLALLHDVSQQSNPRFGVDHTIATVLEKTRQFYDASSCILLMSEAGTSTWSLRAASVANAGRSIHATHLTAEAAAPLLAFNGDSVVLHSVPRFALLRRGEESHEFMLQQQRWTRIDNSAGAKLAELLDARSLVTAPVPLRTGQGRLFLVAARHEFSKPEALFLLHIASQAFPVIENIELLDRMASEAVLRERERIARDLHDSTIQPYIGLRHGVSALRKQAAEDNPLIPDLDSLLAMTTQVIGDLRRYAKNFRAAQELSEPELLVALRRQATQIKQFYGINIDVQSQGKLEVSDRLAAEVFQIVNEGMSNIRKHTDARAGLITLRCARGMLTVRIENECAGDPITNFLPSSIAERALALGGRAQVLAGYANRTAVQIVIPI